MPLSKVAICGMAPPRYDPDATRAMLDSARRHAEAILGLWQKHRDGERGLDGTLEAIAQEAQAILDEEEGCG